MKFINIDINNIPNEEIKGIPFTEDDFIQIAEEKNILVFGKSGIGKASIMSEINQAPTEILNNLYYLSHPQKYTHIRKRIPYKYGKHAYRKGGE